MSEFDQLRIEEQLTITKEMKQDLGAAAKWANFLAIISFIGIGLMVLGALVMLFAGTSWYGYAQLSPVATGITYLVAAAISIFPALYLYNFASKLKQALAGEQQLSLNEGTYYLRKYFKFNGILTIVALGIVVLAIVLALIGGVIAAL